MKLSREEKEALTIIKAYKPHKGFFDLSKKPECITNIEYAKILKIQNYLAGENSRMTDKKVKDANKKHWEELKVLSGNLQNIIFSYWNLAILN